jgi:DNA-binding MarR family transcriptional regulator
MSRTQAAQALIGQVQQMNAVATQMNQAAAHRIGINQLDLQAVQLLRTSSEPMTASHLARATGISTAAATGLVDRLEVAGYVTRVPDSNDRRRTIVRLQPERLAAGVGPTFLPLLQRWNKALAGYTEAELTVAAEVLAAMTDCIDDAVTTLRRPAGP